MHYTSIKYILILVLFFPSIIHGQQHANEALWTFNSDGKIVGSAALDNNQIYMGTTSGTLYALKASTGKEIWKLETDGRWSSKPLISENLLYQINGNGNFYAIDKNSGDVRWIFSTGGEHRMKRQSGSESYDDIWDYYLSGATIDEQTVYFGSSDGHLYALDAKDGRLKWKYKTSGEVHATPLVLDTLVYTGSMGGHMYALNKTNGSLVWVFDTVGARYFPKGAVQRGPVLSDGALLFGSRDYNLYALDPATGTGLWNFRDPGGWIIAAPAVMDGSVFMGSSDSHLFYSVDALSGRMQWKKSLNMRVYGSAVFDRDKVYFGCFNGFLYGLNRKDGSLEWSFQTDGSKVNYHTVFNEKDEFNEDFKLYGPTIEAMINSEEQIQALGSILATPVINDGIIYFGSTDSTFYAVPLPE